MAKAQRKSVKEGADATNSLAEPVAAEAPPPERKPARRDGANAKPRPSPVRVEAAAKVSGGGAGKNAAGTAAAPRSGAPKPAGRKPGWTLRCAYTPAEVEEMFRRWRVQRPDPKSDLDFINPFTLLVAVVLSAQATDASVNLATPPLFAVADTPEKMAALSEAEIGAFVRTIGLWRAKAKNVLALAHVLIRDFGSVVPQTREDLMSLPGVGRKTANVVMNNAFGLPTMGVDTHIFRLGNRLKLAPGKTPDEVERGLVAVIPEHHMGGAHHWLILHGRYVCRARRPECERCVIADLCKADVKTNDVPAPLAPWEERPALPG